MGRIVAKLIVALLLSSSMLSVAIAQTDSKGHEFVIAFPKNHSTAGTHSVFVSSEFDTVGTISILGLDFIQPFSLVANEVLKVNLPLQVEFHPSDAISHLGVRVVSDQEVSVYGLSQERYTTDAYLGLPIDSLGLNYIIPSYVPLRGASYPAQLTVVGAYDATEVTITTTANAGSRIANQPFIITLNRDETYYLESGVDLTGTQVTSDRPVAVLGGVKCANVPNRSSACDHLVEMVPPVATWGKSFLTVPLATRRNGDVFRIIASEDATDVEINGAVVKQINVGEFFETILKTSSIVETSAPSLLVQYSTGGSFDGVTSDPFMMIVPPSEQFMSEYAFTTLGAEIGFTNGFVNVVIPTSDIASLRLDGQVVDNSLFSEVGNSGYSGAQIRSNHGSHIISAPVPFGIYAYGFGTWDSYGYTGGMAFEFINPKGDSYPPNIQLVQLGESIQGTAGDSEDTNLNGVLDDGEDLNNNLKIDRRNEDINGNGIIDDGEDLNQDGIIDIDTGIFKVELSNDSTNLKLETISFVPGALRVDFKIALLDSSATGSGTLVIIDGAGNKVEEPIVLNNKPIMTEVKVISVLSTQDIDLDQTSFNLLPDRIDTQDGNTWMEWDFVNFSIAQQANLDYELVLKNPQPNETRIVTQDLILEYTNVDGRQIRNELGQQVITVANSAFELDANIDKPIYISGESVFVSGEVLNLSSFPADARLKLYIKDKQGNIVALLRDITVEQLGQGVQLDLTDIIFNTDGILLGEYQLVAVLTDKISGVPVEVVKQFTITTENGQFANIQTYLTTDKQIYTPWETIWIDSRVQNVADHSLVENAVGYLTLKAPGIPAQHLETVSLPNLSSQLLRQHQFSYQLDRAVEGQYEFLWEVRTAGNQILSASSTSINVENSLSESLIARVEIEKPSVFYAEANSCQFRLTNRGNAAAETLLVNYKVVNVESGVQLAEKQRNLDLPPLAQDFFNISVDTKTRSGSYVCVLEARIDDEWQTLAADAFEVKIDITLRDRVGTVLILQDEVINSTDEDPDGPIGAVLSEQQTLLGEELEKLGWSFVITSNESEFVSEMLTDNHDVYIVIPERIPLDEETQTLLNYLAFLGDGVFVSQALPHQQTKLEEMLGIELATEQPNVGAVNVTGGGLTLVDAYPLFYKDAAHSVHLRGASVVATFNLINADYQWQYTEDNMCIVTDHPPAMTLHQFGKGSAMYAGFDLLVQSTSEDSYFKSLLGSIAERIDPPVNRVWVGDEKPISLTIESQTSPVIGKLAISLSAGLELTNSGSLIEQSGLWYYPFDLSKDTRFKTDIAVKAIEAGEEKVRLVVISGEGGNAQEQEIKELVIQVKEPEAINNLAQLLGTEIEQQRRNIHLKFALRALDAAQASIAPNDKRTAAIHLDTALDQLSQVELENSELRDFVTKQRLLLSPVMEFGTCIDDDIDDDCEEEDDNDD
ncbi:hypothetical protein [Photobacterium indicum]|uniref:hypothetical protein n=1 Tax=Photobacterium indicum TaxID=81447 RepID=UPI003D0F0DE3